MIFFHRQKNKSSCDTNIETDTPKIYDQASCSTFDDNNLEMPHVSFVIHFKLLLCFVYSITIPALKIHVNFSGF